LPTLLQLRIAELKSELEGAFAASPHRFIHERELKEMDALMLVADKVGFCFWWQRQREKEDSARDRRRIAR
jgi:hypothetical protein